MSQPKIKTGDTVLILTGKDKGKRGKVTQVLPRMDRIVVEGVNSTTKNIRSQKQGEKGQKIEFNAPIHLSNVMFVDPKSGDPTRVGSLKIEGKKVRRAVRTQETIE